MRSNRRQVSLAAALALAAVGLIGVGLGSTGQTALAQAAAETELMQPGPLGEISVGAVNAPVTIIEYASMTCPHCANFAVNTFPTLKEKYIDTGKVRFILREFPLDALAAGGFVLARCAGNDKFLDVVDLLFRTQRTWMVKKPVDALLATLKKAGFSQEKFKACLKDQKLLDGVEWVKNRGIDKFKINSTPTFFINGQVQKGNMSFEDLDKMIQPLVKL